MDRGRGHSILGRLLVLAAFLYFSAARAPETKWYKGNTHTHTLNSDGDSPPAEVVAWYREHGYHFLVLSDHNVLTEVDDLNARFGTPGEFVVIAGEEVSDRFQGKPVHLNGLNLREVVSPQGGATMVQTLQRNVDAIHAAGGVPHINHPNFQWALTAADIRAVENDRLFEIYNGHPRVHNLGGGGSPSLEEMWDEILTSGRLIYGIAVDDAHHFKGEFGAGRSNPGRGWVMVRAVELSPPALLEAMENGDFYATTGVELSDYQVTDESIAIQIREKPTFKYTTYFIGQEGMLLSKVAGLEASYRFKGEEKYVRARIVDSMGYVAWTQPLSRKARD